METPQNPIREMVGHFHAYARGMSRFRWAALGTAWVVALVGWTVVYGIPDTYEARARIYVDTESVLREVVGNLAFAPNMAAEIDVLTRAMLSRPSLERVARDTDLDLRAGTDAQFETLLADLSQSIQIAGGRGDNLYTIGYRDRDRQMAERVVDTLLTTFVEDALGNTRDDSGAAQEFIDAQLTEYEERLDSAEKRLAEFKRENVGLMPGESGDYYTRLQSSMNALAETQSALGLALGRRAELERQLLGEDPTFGIVSSRAVVSDQTDTLIAQYEAEIAELLIKYTENHPDVAARQATIDRLRERRATAVGNAPIPLGGNSEAVEMNPVYQQIKVGLSEADLEVVTLRGKLGVQEAEVERLKGLVNTIPEIERRLTALNRDYEVTQRQYEELLQRRETVRLTNQVGQAGDEVQLRVIEPPLASLQPVSPNRPLLLAAVLVTALASGMVLAFVLNQAQPVVMAVSDLRRAAALPVLGAISLFMTADQRRARRTRLIVFSAGCAGLVVALACAILFQGVLARLVFVVLSSVSA